MNRNHVAAIAVVAALASGSIALAEQGQSGQHHQVGTAGKVSPADKHFMMKAAGGGLAEVELAKVALQKATSPEVKKYAQQMLDDHTKANDELKGIASTKGVTLPTAPDPKHKKLLDKLNGMSGAQFDKTYVREAGVSAHKEMEKLFKDESGTGQDAEVKAFAAKTLPVVEQHLSHSEQLMAAVGGSARAGSRKVASSEAHTANHSAAQKKHGA